MIQYGKRDEMQLKYIEIQGFKSFPERTRLVIDEGITVIVGPNGCGKSNIADAIRWALGEQSPKNLRGGKMEDVIFGGTAARRPVGMAQVELVLESKSDSDDFLELSIIRRVLRSGDSEYMINGAKCRLRDIHERFMDTGLGREGYSIISQGRIEEILSTRREDRRDFFEEATGIVKYKSRKIEAEQKLSNQRASLERVNDIIEALEEQKEPLRAQADDARVFLRLAEEQKALRVNLYLAEVALLEKELTRIAANIDNLQHEIIEKDQEQKAFENNAKSLKIEIDRIARDFEHKREGVNSLILEESKEENEITLCKQNLEYNEKDLQRLSGELTRLEGNLENYDVDLAVHKIDFERESLALNEKQNELADAASKLDEAQQRLMSGERALADLRLDEDEKRGELQKARDEAARLWAALEQQQRRLEEIKRELDEAERDLGGRDAGALTEAKNELDRELARLSVGIEKERLELADKRARYAQLKGRRDTLAELAAGYEGFHNSVQRVFRFKKELPRELAGVRGAVAQLVRVDKRYETAIEAALGGAMQHIITDNESDAQRAIELLRAHKAGRATFLPITAAKPRILSDGERTALSEPGILAAASECVARDADYDGVIESLLGRVLIADNLDNAVDFSKKSGYAFRIVTLEGDVVAPSGSLTGGSSGRDARLLGRGREIEEIDVQLERLEAEIETGEHKAEEADAQKRKLEDELGAVGRGLIRLEEICRSLERLQDEKAKVIQGLDEKQGGLDDLEGFKTELEAEIESMTAEKAALRETQAKRLADSNELERDATSLRIDISAAQVRVANLQDNLERIESTAKTGKNEIELIMEQRHRLTEKAEAIEEDIKRRGQRIDEIAGRREVLERDVHRLNESREHGQQRLAEIEQAYAQVSKNANTLTSEMIVLKSNEERAQEGLRRLHSSIWDEYELTFHQMQAQPRLELGVPAMRRRERDVRDEIRELGPVNIAAIEDLAALAHRLDYLASQRQDILDAEGKILKIIKELKELMCDQFSREMQVLSANFARVFAEIFGGGEAYLKISDENDILESGIEIFASPPGKKLQSMTLLSGGERALCAIALLFAILWQRPSPFCVLDEIEAALDDGNIQRFTAYLQKIKGNSQFIIITHRKGTMEIADTIFGVTMEEKGVSKLVSARFESRDKDCSDTSE